MRIKGYKCYNVKCGSCVYKTMCGEPYDIALGCPNRVVNIQSNADRIRAMSDEEMAKFIPKELVHVPTSGLEIAIPAWLKWLQSPAEEDDHAE